VKGQYINRYDNACVQLQFNICKEIGVKLHNEYRCDHVPKSIETSHKGKVNILGNQKMQTDGTKPNNKLCILTHDNGKRTGRLRDTALSVDRNVIKKAEEILKYNRILAYDDYESKLVINGATGTI
jgi:hypothetical protein